MKIAVDAMGGDHAPEEVVKGAIVAAKELNVEILLVGDQVKIEHELAKHHAKNDPSISIVHASQVVAMGESPVSAIKTKKDSSINVGLNLVKEGKAEGFVSAGNTGAVMSSATLNWGRIKDIERPAIAVVWPSKKGHIVLLDVGANAECKPKHILQFAYLGSIFSEQVLHTKSPKVGLLSIGEEEEKGNTLVAETLPLLKASQLNFVGNVESKDIFGGEVDVFVCDGFVGNMLLKFAEGILDFMYGLIKGEIKKNWLAMLGALLLKPVFKSIQKKTDYDECGGALLLGVKGICVISHGRSKAKAIKNAIKVAKESVEANILGKFAEIG
ncbi:MAG: phosphate acyltransferase PlsX [Candidatus Margulisiibacteriota bacterium]|jgi:glycerol-3-phosphate acyltransferase PlsX